MGTFASTEAAHQQLRYQEDPIGAHLFLELQWFSRWGLIAMLAFVLMIKPHVLEQVAEEEILAMHISQIQDSLESMIKMVSC